MTAELDFTKMPWHELGFMEELYLEDPGPRLHFARCNASHRDAVPTIVFLHGVLRDWRSFYPLLISLRGKANLVSIDFRGHGGSAPVPNAYLVADYIDDAVRLVESVGCNVFLYGHSLGAMVALGAAARIPERIETAILEDPPFETMGSRLFNTPLKRYFQAVEAVVENERTQARTGLETTTSEARVQRIHDEFSNIEVGIRDDGSILRVRDQRDAISRRFSAEALARVDPRVLAPITAGQWLSGYELGSLLPSIQTRVVLLRADAAYGGMLTCEEADHIGRQLSGLCEQIYFTGIGHSIHWSKPMELTDLILKQISI